MQHLMRGRGCQKQGSLAEAEVFGPLASASVAEGLRPKLLAEGLGHIFGKIFRCDGQSVLITISFLQFLYFRYKKISLFCKICRLFRN